MLAIILSYNNVLLYLFNMKKLFNTYIAHKQKLRLCLNSHICQLQSAVEGRTGNLHVTHVFPEFNVIFKMRQMYIFFQFVLLKNTIKKKIIAIIFHSI